MLNRLVICTILAVTCSAPVPGQATNHGSESSQKPKSQADQSDTPAKSTIPLVEKNCDSAQFKDDPDCKKGKNDVTPVVIREIPTTNVSVQRSDIYDWIAYWAAIALVIAGLVGIRFGYKTLNAISTQVDLMKRQADAMDAQNKATQDKERARLSISGVSAPEFQPVGSFHAEPNMVPVLVHIFIAIDGTSHASNVDGFGSLKVEPIPDAKHIPSGFRLKLPRIIRFTETAPIKVPVTGAGDVAGAITGDFTNISASLAEDVMTCKQSLRISGVIYYEDVFGKIHQTPFDYAWFVPAYDSTGRWAEGCHWMDQSAQST